jgi:hypothetical protein
MNTDYIAAEFGYLSEGDTMGGQLCPECGGGRSRERSLRVSRYNGRLRAKCYRDSCQWKYYGNGTAFIQSMSPNVPKELAPFATTNNRPMTDAEKDRFSVLFGIEQGMFDWARWSHVDDCKSRGPRFVLPILSPDGRVRGKTYRSWDGHEPKAQINKLAEENMICWYKPKPYGKVLAIVEDQPSALRIAGAGVDALSLCGTLLNDSRLAEIKKQGHDRVWLCLDQDATLSAFKILAEYKLRHSQLRIKTLPMDVKNMSTEQFEQYIREVTDL